MERIFNSIMEGVTEMDTAGMGGGESTTNNDVNANFGMAMATATGDVGDSDSDHFNFPFLLPNELSQEFWTGPGPAEIEGMEMDPDDSLQNYYFFEEADGEINFVVERPPPIPVVATVVGPEYQYLSPDQERTVALSLNYASEDPTMLHDQDGEPPIYFDLENQSIVDQVSGQEHTSVSDYENKGQNMSGGGLHGSSSHESPVSSLNFHDEFQGSDVVESVHFNQQRMGSHRTLIGLLQENTREIKSTSVDAMFEIPAESSINEMSPRLEQLFAAKIQEGSSNHLKYVNQVEQNSPSDSEAIPMNSSNENPRQATGLTSQHQENDSPQKMLHNFTTARSSPSQRNNVPGSSGKANSRSSQLQKNKRATSTTARFNLERSQNNRTNGTGVTAIEMNEMSDRELVDFGNQLLQERCILKSTSNLLLKRQAELQAQNARLMGVARQGGLEDFLRRHSQEFTLPESMKHGYADSIGPPVPVRKPNCSYPQSPLSNRKS